MPQNAGIEKGIGIRKRYCIFLNDFSSAILSPKDIDFASMGILWGSKSPAATELSVEIDCQKVHFLCMKHLSLVILLALAPLSWGVDGDANFYQFALSDNKNFYMTSVSG